MSDHQGLYIMMISVHGLIRGRNLELGRDADTGGQTTYVVELAKELSQRDGVAQVDLVTRCIVDKNISDDYSIRNEPLSKYGQIVRIPFGPKRYLYKEKLWPYLESFADSILQYIGKQGRLPDIIHGHYADAGYVASKLGRLLGVPIAFTGHSLGRVKRERLLEKGGDQEKLENKFHFLQRIEAEETALDASSFVVVSTEQEIQEQYFVYDFYKPERKLILPPGVDLSRFSPPGHSWQAPPISDRINMFLKDVNKPMILTMARPDLRKNLGTLVDAFGMNKELQDKANLVLVMGNRESISEKSKSEREVINSILHKVDDYNLYGKVAYPKNHQAHEVPQIYQTAAASGGVFVNPALTEPFGLTLIESAASGLPIVATNDGGPRDIIKACKNGVLIDPADPKELGKVLLAAVSNKRKWNKWSKNGIKGARDNYTWSGHAIKYVEKVREELSKHNSEIQLGNIHQSRIPFVDRILITDVDNTLIGDEDGLRLFMEKIKESKEVGFGIATGRNLEQALAAFREHKETVPDVLITSAGTQINYGKNLTIDRSWQRHISYNWNPEAVKRALEESDIKGLKLQSELAQSRFKISYLVDKDKGPTVARIKRHLRKQGLQVKVMISFGVYLDILPVRGTPGQAIRFLSMKWGIPPEKLLVAGDSGNDEDMLTGNTLGVVVGNYSKELDKLRGKERVYFAKAHNAWGILEGIDYYNFFEDIRIPQEENAENEETYRDSTE